MLDNAPRHVRRRFYRLRAAVRAIDAASATRQKCRVTIRRARALGLAPHTLHGLRCDYHRSGEIALLDKRFSAACWQGKHAAVIPAAAVKHLQAIAAKSPESNQAVIRQFLARVASGRVPGVTLPGPGLSVRNLSRYLRGRKNPARVPIRRVLIEARADGRWKILKIWRKTK